MLSFPTWKISFIVIVCFSALFLALPNILSPEMRKSIPSWLPNETVNLGLDLRGGSYLLLEVDFNTYLQEQMEFLLDDIRRILRKERIGYRNLAITSWKNDSDVEKFVSFTLRDTEKISEVKKIAEDLSGEIRIEINDSSLFKLHYTKEALRRMSTNVIEQSIEIVRRRVDETGTREPIIQRQGNSRILLQVPGLENPEQLKRLLGKTAKMTFHLMDESNPFPTSKVRPSPGTKILRGDGEDANRYYMVQKKVVLSGDYLIDSRPTFDQGQPVISFRFNNRGGKIFGKITKENSGKPFAIVLDNKVITAPRINEPILSGAGIISGSFTLQSANDLSLLLRAGALPAPLKILEERTVGPSLGKDSIDAGKKAAAIGIIFILLLMIAFYGLFGLFSNIALLINMMLVLAVLSLFEATLTLPGIAGLVLTMGMAVDANVLIFERMREELRIGKTPFAATDNGFRQAFKTIIDSNFTTLIATLLLFLYGTGPVKGFAVTLSIGIICSMFSAILLTRLMIVLWMKKNRPSSLPI